MFDLHKIRFNLSDECCPATFSEFGESAPPLVERCSCTICVKEHSKRGLCCIPASQSFMFLESMLANGKQFPHTFCCFQHSQCGDFPPFLVITLHLPQEVSGYCSRCLKRTPCGFVAVAHRLSEKSISSLNPVGMETPSTQRPPVLLLPWQQ